MLRNNNLSYKKSKNNHEVIRFLEKNKNFLVQNSHLLKILEFPSHWKTKGKVIDFNKYQSKKLKTENNNLKNKISKILSTSYRNFNSQNKIFKSCLKILNAKNLFNYLKVIKIDCKKLLSVDMICLYSNNNKLENLIKKNKLLNINEKNLNKIFTNNHNINLSNKTDLIPIFFPLGYKIIKSFILLKIKIDKKHFLIIGFGSKNKNKFSTKQGNELINFFIRICEYKIKDLF